MVRSKRAMRNWRSTTPSPHSAAAIFRLMVFADLPIEVDEFDGTGGSGKFFRGFAVDGFAGRREKLMEFSDGLGAALFGGVECVGGFATSEGVAEIGGESFGCEIGEGIAGGGELAGGELLGFPGLCQGGLAGSGVAVGFFENLDADFEIAQGLACAGDLISVALQGTGRRFDTGAVLFGAAAGGGFSSFCLVEIFP